MKLPGIFHSPLSATAAVVVGLTLIAIPLRRLTRPAVQERGTTPVLQQPREHTPCWMTLKLLAPARAVTLSTTSGETLWSLSQTPAGETETRKALPISADATEFILQIECGNPDSETAAFLSIAPDTLNEVTAYAIGKGTIRELLRFDWQTP